MMPNCPTHLEQAGLKGVFIRCQIPVSAKLMAGLPFYAAVIGMMWTGQIAFLLVILLVPLFAWWRMSCGWRVDDAGLHALVWPVWRSFPFQGLQILRPDTYRHHLFGMGKALVPGLPPRLIPIPAPWTLTETLISHHMKAKGAEISVPWDFELIFDPDRAASSFAEDARDFGHFRLSGRRFQRMIACQVHWEVDLAGAEHRIEVRQGRFGIEIRQLLVLADGRHLTLKQWAADSEPFDQSLAVDLAARGVKSLICKESDLTDFPMGLRPPTLNA